MLFLIWRNIMEKELDDIDHEMESMTEDYPEPEEWERFYEYKHKLWEMRFGYREDKNKSFEDNVRYYIKFNYRRIIIKQILDMKNSFFHETGEIL
jgi:hypothetical protein